MARYPIIYFLVTTFLFPLATIAQTSLTPEDCASSCDLYKAWVEGVHQSDTPNVYKPGTPLNTTTIESLCQYTSDSVDTCATCTKRGMDQYVSGNLDVPLMYSWYYTCQTYSQQGKRQAVSCWEALPDSIQGCSNGNAGISGTPTEAAGGATGLTSSTPSSSSSSSSSSSRK